MKRTNSIGFGSLRKIFHATKLIDDPPRGGTANETIGQRKRGVAPRTLENFLDGGDFTQKPALRARAHQGKVSQYMNPRPLNQLRLIRATNQHR
jgi:hypothetical protein